MRLATAPVPTEPGSAKPLYREAAKEVDKRGALMLGLVTTERRNIRSIAVGKDFHCVLTEEGTVEDSRVMQVNASGRTRPGAQVSFHVSEQPAS